MQKEECSVHFRLSPEVKETLVTMADEEGRSLSNLMQKMVKDFLTKKDQTDDDQRES